MDTEDIDVSRSFINVPLRLSVVVTSASALLGFCRFAGVAIF